MKEKNKWDKTKKINLKKKMVDQNVILIIKNIIKNWLYFNIKFYYF
jgi:hypothetical protein